MRAIRADNIYKFLSDETYGTHNSIAKVVDEIMACVDKYAHGYHTEEDLIKSIEHSIERLSYHQSLELYIRDQILEYIFTLVIESDDESNDDDQGINEPS
jgi:hypothetical protein